MIPRPYRQLAEGLKCGGDRQQRMQAVVNALWDALHDTGVSWVGFYLPGGPDELVLGPLRDTPACSPIGLHGVCGRAFTQRRPQVVHDVRELGEEYVACDPRDSSEVVVPLFEAAGACWGVLDLDSHEVGAFSAEDVAGLVEVLRVAGLTV
ncbi:MAG: GAF domain-containing protein [Planctomycetes bacterium]|nr:GAF domain-containing protein [Planctomycetota bacterium]